MRAPTLLELTKWTAVGSAGLYGGGSLLMNAAMSPAVLSVKDPRVVRQCWREMINRGKKIQLTLAFSAAAAGVASWYLSEGDYRWLFLVGADAMFIVFPYSYLFMSSDYKKITDEHHEDGEWVVDTVRSLNKRQIFKTLMGMLASDLFVWAIFLNK